MNSQKLFPKKSKVLKVFLIFSLVLLLIIYGLFSSRFGWAYQGEEMLMTNITRDIICLLIWLVVSLVLLYIFLTQNYYLISNDGIIHHKRTKESKYHYSNILYIDEFYTKKHSTLLFYTKEGKAVYLMLDKENKLLSLIEKNSKNLISRDEFHSKFPNIKLW